MKVTCQTKGCEGEEFVTVAHVTEDWKIDEKGNFLEKVGLEQETIAGPTIGNTFTCFACGAEAKVEE